jgi:hypothetical protein
VLRVGEQFAPIPFAPVLEQAVVPGVRQIVDAATKVAYVA